MSRAYRIKVEETIRRIIRSEDHVSTQLELLELLPKEQMAELLGQELAKRGFERDGNQAVKQDGDTSVSVDLETAEQFLEAGE